MHLAAFFFDHWLFHPLVGRGYQFYSGVAGDLVYLSLFGALYHHLNCAEPGCPWVGKAHRDHRCRKHSGPRKDS